MSKAETLANLENEWKYLLVAAKTWDWLRNHKEAGAVVPLHTRVMAMDSAYLHGRNLYEFFGQIRGEKAETKKSATTDLFGVGPDRLKRGWIATWGEMMQARLFHPREERTDAQPQGTMHLNEQVCRMRDDLLLIWNDFLRLVPDGGNRADLERVMRTARHDLDNGDLVGRLEVLSRSHERT